MLSLEFWIDVAGWVGALEVIGAYLWISSGRVTGAHVGYQILNLTGGILLIANTFYKEAYPSMFVNVIWVMIATWAIVKPFLFTLRR